MTQRAAIAAPIQVQARPSPGTAHITYQLQYRKCGKPSCRRCREGQKHGPYWYGYWREGGKLHSRYIGKTRPDEIAARAGKGDIR